LNLSFHDDVLIGFGAVLARLYVDYDVSEKHTASIFRAKVTMLGEMEVFI
jgi:hypothetical protein